MANDFLTLIRTRRSIRAYKPDAVPADVLARVLEAGTYAPSALGKQSATIVAVETKTYRDRLAKLNAAVIGKDVDPYYGAPVIVVVLGDGESANYLADGSCVLENLMLAAHAEGLGTVWVNREREIFDSPDGKALLRDWGLPETLRGVGAVALGYAAGPAPEDAPRKENYIVHVCAFAQAESPPAGVPAGGLLCREENRSVDVDDRLGQLRGGHIGVVIMLAAVGDPADRDCLPRAVLQAAQALDAVAANDGAAALDADVAARADPGALAAANARIADGELLCLAGHDLRPDTALELVEGLFRRSLGRDRTGKDGLRDLLCFFVRAALRHGGRHRRQHHAVRQHPDARALVRHGRPVAQGDDAVELVQAGAHIARILADAERVRREADPDLAQRLLHAAGQTAAVAREDEADAPGVTHIRDRRLPAHENDVRVAQLPGNGFRHVETVSGARVAEDHIFAHVKHSLKF